MKPECGSIPGKAGAVIVAVAAWVFTSAVLGAIGTALWESFWYVAVVLFCTAPLSGAWHAAARLRKGKRSTLKAYLRFLPLFHACILAAGFFVEEDFSPWVFEITWRMAILYGIMAVQASLVEFLLDLCGDDRDWMA